MTDGTLHAYLAQHPFFKGLTSDQLNLVASHAATVHYGPQQRVFKQDTTADKFYVLREGKIAVEVPSIGGEPLTIQTLGEGRVLGWSWLIPPYRWLFDARATAPSTVIVMDGEQLRRECENDPRLGYELLKRFAVLMAERLNAARLAAIKQYTGA